MSDTLLAMLRRLAEVKPDRFLVNKKCFFFDGELSVCIDPETAYGLDSWFFQMMNELEFAAIWKQAGRTWEESVLNAIVHHFEREAYKEEIKVANDGMCGNAE